MFAVQEVLRNAPRFIDVLDPETPSACSPGQSTTATYGSQGSSMHSGSGIDTSNGSVSQLKLHQQPAGADSPGVSVGTASVNSSAAANILKSSLHVYLCIAAGGSYRFSDVVCRPKFTDISFFESLKAQYLRSRGWLPYIFSMWRFDHCEFYRVSMC